MLSRLRSSAGCSDGKIYLHFQVVEMGKKRKNQHTDSVCVVPGATEDEWLSLIFTNTRHFCVFHLKTSSSVNTSTLYRGFIIKSDNVEIPGCAMIINRFKTILNYKSLPTM